MSIYTEVPELGGGVLIPKANSSGMPTGYNKRALTLHVGDTDELINGSDGGRLLDTTRADLPALSTAAYKAIQAEALEKYETDDLMSLDREVMRELVYKAVAMMQGPSLAPGGKTEIGSGEIMSAAKTNEVITQSAKPAAKPKRPAKKRAIKHKATGKPSQADVSRRERQLEDELRETRDRLERLEAMQELLDDSDELEVEEDEPEADLQEFLSTLGIPGLAVEPRKPRFRVDFHLGDYGAVTAHYHWISVHDSLLVLVRDTRGDDGIAYSPPYFGMDRLVEVDVYLGTEQPRRFNCYSCGANFPHGFQQFVLLMIVSDKEKTRGLSEQAYAEGNVWLEIPKG